MSRAPAARALLLVVATALLAFSPSLGNGWVNWDDQWLVLGNPYVRGFHHLSAIFDPTGDRMLLGAEYLPLRDVSLLVDFRLFGVEPRGYHLANLLLYGVGCGLVYAFLCEALGRGRAALFGALLFAVHPLHAEAVAWVSARKDLLNLAFAALAGTLHLRAARTGSRAAGALAVAAFLGATLSKTAAASLPLGLALVEVLRGDPSVALKVRVGRALRRAAPMLLLAAAGALLNSWHQKKGWVKAEWRGGGWAANFMLMCGVHLRYLAQSVLPVGLAPDYAVDAAHPDRAWNLLGLLALLGGIAGAVALARRRPAAGAFACWWFVLLLPVANVVVPITNVSADRYTLLPSVGLCALAGMAAAAAGRAAVPALGAVALLLAVLAARQCTVWRDALTLWAHATRVSPGVGRVWSNYGEALAMAGRRDEALAAFRRMVEVEPWNAALWVHAGNRLWELGGPARRDEVEAILRRAVERAGPGEGGPLVALAWVLDRTGRVEESVGLLRQAVRKQPTLAEGHYNLGLWHASEKHSREAVVEIEKALELGLPQLRNRFDAHDTLYRIHSALGDAEKARFHREERERYRALRERGE